MNHAWIVGRMRRYKHQPEAMEYIGFYFSRMLSEADPEEEHAAMTHFEKTARRQWETFAGFVPFHTAVNQVMQTALNLFSQWKINRQNDIMTRAIDEYEYEWRLGDLEAEYGMEHVRQMFRDFQAYVHEIMVDTEMGSEGFYNYVCEVMGEDRTRAREFRRMNPPRRELDIPPALLEMGDSKRHKR